LPSKLGTGQAAVQVRLSLCMSLDGLVFRCIPGDGGDSVFSGLINSIILKGVGTISWESYCMFICDSGSSVLCVYNSKCQTNTAPSHKM
jgi:hypothetical protein